MCWKGQTIFPAQLSSMKFLSWKAPDTISPVHGLFVICPSTRTGLRGY